MIVSGYIIFEPVWSENFQNKCSVMKDDFVKSLSSYMILMQTEGIITISIYSNKRLWLIDSAELDYLKILITAFKIMCSHSNSDDKVRSRLFISLMDQDFLNMELCHYGKKLRSLMILVLNLI